jgi:hypothetical protein
VAAGTIVLEKFHSGHQVFFRGRNGFPRCGACRAAAASRARWKKAFVGSIPSHAAPNATTGRARIPIKNPKRNSRIALPDYWI